MFSTRPTTRRRFLGFSLVEMLATTAIIGLIAFMAFPKVSKMREDSELNLAIARAEALNLGVTNLIQQRGRSQSVLDWTSAGNNNARYGLIRPYIAFSESTLAGYLPSGYTVNFPSSLDSATGLAKAQLFNPSGTEIKY